jgi:hypothetical protein
VACFAMMLAPGCTEEVQFLCPILAPFSNFRAIFCVVVLSLRYLAGITLSFQRVHKWSDPPEPGPTQQLAYTRRVASCWAKGARGLVPVHRSRRDARNDRVLQVWSVLSSSVNLFCLGTIHIYIYVMCFTLACMVCFVS